MRKIHGTEYLRIKLSEDERLYSYILCIGSILLRLHIQKEYRELEESISISPRRVREYSSIYC